MLLFSAVAAPLNNLVPIDRVVIWYLLTALKNIPKLASNLLNLVIDRMEWAATPFWANNEIPLRDVSDMVLLLDMSTGTSLLMLACLLNSTLRVLVVFANLAKLVCWKLLRFKLLLKESISKTLLSNLILLAFTILAAGYN